MDEARNLRGQMLGPIPRGHIDLARECSQRREATIAQHLREHPAHSSVAGLGNSVLPRYFVAAVEDYGTVYLPRRPLCLNYRFDAVDATFANAQVPVTQAAVQAGYG